jgi:uridine kinase
VTPTELDLDAVVEQILKRPGPVRLVAIDGPGGSGKSTIADRLSDAAGGAPIVHTDDFASWDNPINWWPRLFDQVIKPLANGELGRFQRYDWPSDSLREWHSVPRSPIVIVEGVTSARWEWLQHLSFVIWVETPRELRLERAVERDGPSALADWERWMAEEDDHYLRDPTKERADMVIDGTI